ncbi:ExeM/NucH family extracellular endonuclease [Gallaecimonas sp. GXIMD4217]|uniref:ExeM/NucH family extracellular endonuclease n=1 Tax=Gallaecimonas sp. GXIMD4217 TaxID=3131927 RepID=UPI00311B1CD1
MLRKTQLAMAVALCCQPALADVLFTEYVEGSSNNKAVEIANLGDGAVELSSYQLKRFSNGSSHGAAITLSGQLAAGEAIVIANPAASFLAGGMLTNSNISHNGDDAIGLYKAGELVDVIGVIGQDPGSAWTAAGKSTKDMTLRRLDGVSRGAASFDFSQWQAFPKDSFDGLGCAGEAACSATVFQCPDDLTPIYAIQGDGARSPLVPNGRYQSDESYATRGVVTQVMTSLYKGFFIQDAQGDGNALTSDGLFVHTGATPASDIEPGMEVCVTGKVKEYYGFTQLSADGYGVVAGPVSLPEAGQLFVDEGETLHDALERYEGMLLRWDNLDMAVTRSFGYDYDSRRNNMVLSLGEPHYKATQLYPALSEEALALAEANRRNRLYIDSDQRAPNGVVPYFPGFDADQGYIRIGDKVRNMEGVLGYSYNEYRLIPTLMMTAGDFEHGEHDRTAEPVLDAEGDLRVASFNVLNFFTTAVGGDANPTGQNRGARSEAEFLLQRTKIVNALLAMDADIIGLMELENNGFGDNSAVANLVGSLNAELAEADRYAFVASPDGGPIGSDAITVGLLYRPAKVALQGQARILTMPRQVTTVKDKNGQDVGIDQGMRDSLIQGFRRISGGMAAGDTFNLVVNHFKSKGSSCAEDYPHEADVDPADLQGHCNELRVSAALRLGQAVNALAGESIVLGDLNAYAMEDPLLVLTDYQADGSRDIVTAGNTFLDGAVLDAEPQVVSQGQGLIKLSEPEAYSYSYEGELGSLDHALATPGLADKVVAIGDWHINAVESSLFEYSGRYTGDLVKSEGPYSSSDHDPVLLELAMPLPGKASFATERLVVAESDGELRFPIERIEGADGELVVNARLRFLGNGRDNGKRRNDRFADARDIQLVTDSVRFADGEAGTQELVLALTQDRATEHNERLVLEVDHLVDGRLLTSEVDVVIQDSPKDRPWFAFWR